MARSNSEITPAEVQAYAKFCAKRGIIHDGSEDGSRNADFIAKYFVNIWKEDITEQNLNAAWDQIRPHLKFYAPNQQEANELINKLSAEEQKVLAEWKAPRGLKSTHRVVAAMLSWLAAHGFRVTKENLQLAVGQNRVQPFLEWDESATPPKPVDARQHADDGTPFLGRDVNEPRWKRIQREREEREAKDAASRPSAASVQSVTVREAQKQAEQLRGNTHSETEQLMRIFVTTPGTSEINWPDTLASRLQMQRAFQKHREVARFVR